MGLDGRGWKKSVGGEEDVEIRNDLDGFIAVCNGKLPHIQGFQEIFNVKRRNCPDRRHRISRRSFDLLAMDLGSRPISAPTTKSVSAQMGGCDSATVRTSGPKRRKVRLVGAQLELLGNSLTCGFSGPTTPISGRDQL
jgi:hypothetical protein